MWIQTGTYEISFSEPSIYREQKQCSIAQGSFLTSYTTFFGWIMWWLKGYSHHQAHSFEAFEVWGFFERWGRCAGWVVSPFVCLGFSGFGMVPWSTTSFCTDLSVCGAVSHGFPLTTAAQSFNPFLTMLYQRCQYLWLVGARCKRPHLAHWATAIPPRPQCSPLCQHLGSCGANIFIYLLLTHSIFKLESVSTITTCWYMDSVDCSQLSNKYSNLKV